MSLLALLKWLSWVLVVVRAPSGGGCEQRRARQLTSSHESVTWRLQSHDEQKLKTGKGASNTFINQVKASFVLITVFLFKTFQLHLFIRDYIVCKDSKHIVSYTSSSLLITLSTFTWAHLLWINFTLQNNSACKMPYLYVMYYVHYLRVCALG